MEAVSSAEPEGAGWKLQSPPGGQRRRSASALRFSHLPHMRSGHQENITFTSMFRLPSHFSTLTLKLFYHNHFFENLGQKQIIRFFCLKIIAIFPTIFVNASSLLFLNTCVTPQCTVYLMLCTSNFVCNSVADPNNFEGSGAASTSCRSG
jgi:hypothetical protein